MKSEPSEFSIDDLAARPRKTEPWDGIRNYQVRNMMRDEMRKGDLAFFYHSSCAVPGIVGIMKICRESYPDTIEFGRKGKPVKPNKDLDNPTWFMVDVQFQRKLKRPISLQELKSHAALADMPLVRKGNRLSVMPVSELEWEFILGLE